MGKILPIKNHQKQTAGCKSLHTRQRKTTLLPLFGRKGLLKGRAKTVINREMPNDSFHTHVAVAFNQT